MKIALRPVYAVSLLIYTSVGVLPLAAQDQTISGNLTVTGSIAAGGAIDSDSNSLSFGAQNGSFGAALIHQDSGTDTFTFLSNRSPASWLWQHTVAVAAMRLDSNHQLILYKADGTTTGITLTPASSAIKLGTHANGTLTADTNGVITAAGGFAVAGGITNTSGTFTGGSSGLAFNAGGTNQSIALTPSGSGRTIISNGSFTGDVWMQNSKWIGSGGGEHHVGFGTNNGRLQLTGDWVHSVLIGDTGLEYYNGALGLTKWYMTAAGAMALYAPIIAPSGQEMVKWSWVSNAVNELTIANAVTGNAPALLASGDDPNINLALSTKGSGKVVVTASALTVTGNVGVGTTAPEARFQVNGTARFGLSSSNMIEISNDDNSIRHRWTNDGAGINRYQIVGNAGNVFGLTGNDGGALRLSASNGNHVTIYPRQGGGGTIRAAATDAITFTNTGNVGIGTTNPGAKLMVEADGSAALPGVYPTEPKGYFVSWAGDGPSSDSGVSLFQITAGRIASTDTYAANARLFQVSTDDGPRFVVKGNGNVGIGTTSPGARLTVSGAGYPFWMLEDTANQSFVSGRSDGYVFFNNGGSYTISSQAYAGRGTPVGDTARLTIVGSSGNVGIGTTNPTHKLAVKGTIRAEEVIVDTGWADYVFEEDYRLAPLAEVEQHIKAKKHLPGIPSAAEVAVHGVSMGDMQSKLLSKVEELTLHLIAQEKRLSLLESENRELKAKLAQPRP